MVAARKNFIRKHAKLRAKHIGGVKGVAERWEVDCAFNQFDAYELAVDRQHHLTGAAPLVERQVEMGFGGVGVRFEGFGRNRS